MKGLRCFTAYFAYVVQRASPAVRLLTRCCSHLKRKGTVAAFLRQLWWTPLRIGAIRRISLLPNLVLQAIEEGLLVLSAEPTCARMSWRYALPATAITS